jgi:hypothetical protein
MNNSDDDSRTRSHMKPTRQGGIKADIKHMSTSYESFKVRVRIDSYCFLKSCCVVFTRRSRKALPSTQGSSRSAPVVVCSTSCGCGWIVNPSSSCRRAGTGTWYDHGRWSFGCIFTNAKFIQEELWRHQQILALDLWHHFGQEVIYVSHRHAMQLIHEWIAHKDTQCEIGKGQVIGWHGNAPNVGLCRGMSFAPNVQDAVY